MAITLTQLHEHATTQTQRYLDRVKNLHNSLGEHLGEPEQHLEMLESNADSLFKNNFHALLWKELQEMTVWLLEHPETEPKQRLQDWLKRKQLQFQQMYLQNTDWHPNPMRRFRENRQREAFGGMLPTLKSKIERLE